MADYSLANMPWLLQSGDAGTSLAKGATAGAQIAQARLARQSLAQRRYEFAQSQSLQKDQFELDKKIAPLREKAFSMASRKTELELGDLERNLKWAEQHGEAAGQLSNLIVDSVLNGIAGTPEIAGQVENLLKTRPDLRRMPDILKWLEVYNESAKIQVEQRAREEKANQPAFTPGFGQAFSPATGQWETYWQGGPSSAELLSEKKAPVPTAIQIADRMTELQRKLADSVSTPEAKAEAQMQLNNLKSQVGNQFEQLWISREEAEKSGDNEKLIAINKQLAGTQFRLQFGEQGQLIGLEAGKGIGGGPTTSTLSKLEQGSASQASVLAVLDDTILRGDEKQFGIWARTGEIFWDQIAANLPFVKGNIARTTGRSANEFLVQLVAEAIHPGDRVSQDDIKNARVLVGDRGFFTSPEQTKAKWLALKRNILITARTQGEINNSPRLWAYKVSELIDLPRRFSMLDEPVIRRELVRRGLFTVQDIQAAIARENQ